MNRARGAELDLKPLDNNRSFSTKQVDEKTQESILTALSFAPSYHGTQPWKVLDISNQEWRPVLAEMLAGPDQPPRPDRESWILRPPAVWLVALDRRHGLANASGRYQLPDTDRGEPHPSPDEPHAGRHEAHLGHDGLMIALQDVAFAVQNARLAAQAAGVASCYSRDFDPVALHDRLGLPHSYVPCGILVFGYAEHTSAAAPRLPIEDFFKAWPYDDHEQAQPVGETSELATAGQGTEPSSADQGLQPSTAGQGSQIPAVDRKRRFQLPFRPIPAVYERRSVRAYQDREVPEGWLELMLDAFRQAPSQGNMQAWDVIVVEDPEQRDAVIGTTYSGYYSDDPRAQGWMHQAPLLLAVACNTTLTAAKYGAEAPEIALIDAAAAVENMLLTATALGLDSCWVGGYDEERLSRVFELPEGVRMVGLITIGFGTEHPVPRPRVPLGDFVHRDKYGRGYYA